MRRLLLFHPLALALLIGCNPAANAPALNAGAKMSLTSSAFAEGQPIPPRYAHSGDNKSPPLAWADAPKGVKCFALICDDPDAPTGTFTHWVIWNIPGDAQELGEGEPTDASMRDGTRQGENDFGGVGYAGPDPPAGKAHRYFFRLYALDATLELPEASTTRQDLDRAMTGHVIGHGELMGTYQKQ